MVESSSPVSVLFREVFSHPCISFFHLLVNFFVLSVGIHHSFRRVFSERIEAITTYHIPYTNRELFS